MTDTCNTAQKFKRLLFGVITKKAHEKGVSEDQMCVYQVDYWHHLGNVWINRIYATVAYMQPPFFRGRPTYERILANARVAKNNLSTLFWYVVHT